MDILAIDGGGIRGIYAARILRRLQEETGCSFSQQFDLIAGTSTGAIIAAALATDYPVKDVEELYEREGKRIFKRNLLGFFGMLMPQHTSAHLHFLLKQAFPNQTLSDTKTNLLIPATNIGGSTVHVQKSNYDPEFVRDRKTLIADAILGSCSAPMYFPPHLAGDFLLADGGLWANNPSLACIAEATKRFRCPLSDIRILSIGTGHENHAYKLKTRFPRLWGLLTGWKGQKLVSSILSLQSESAHNMNKLMLHPENYLRIDFSSDTPLPLNDVHAIDDLKSRAEKDFSNKFDEICKFLGRQEAPKEP